MDRERDESLPSPKGADEGAAERERRSSYLSFVAHEARNPLATALWSAELLARISTEERASPRGEKLAATCRRSLDRLRRLVEDHLFSERLDAGGLPMHPEAVSLEELVAAAARRAGLEDWKGDLGSDLQLVADRAVAERCVEGVLAAAGRGGAAVEVHARLKQSRVVLTIRGAEPGPEAMQDPRRGSAPADRARPLALSMARRAARAAGGRLAVQGGAYCLELPAA
ncbi:MAG TPA: histidine kinase dimerization/phospho-acceptor domain-containing protein [Anaeromyxobacteraceae bacterium]|nr:histidine kinase dimerization/phospho-acceptor domain-containing protein [Anaeromyxobacteraceae bacterium]